jgi:hypothetical protein
MLKFSATIEKFGEMGEKTGWSYIKVPAEIAGKLKPGMKKSFRVKGKLDDYPIAAVALIPMGGGDFILGVNAKIRKGTGKRHGQQLKAQLEVDDDEIKPPAEFIDCLKDEPAALEFFQTLPRGHRNYFGKWVSDAKTIETKTKRMTAAVEALRRKMGFSEMVREMKEKKDKLTG